MRGFLKHIASVTGCVLLLSTAATAQTSAPSGTVVFEDIDPKTQRRMGFYAERTLGALLALAEDDIRVSQEGAQPNHEVTNSFREALERFVQAGMDAGMSHTALADYLDAQFEQNYTGPDPHLFVTTDGNLDSRTLVEGTVINLSAKAAQGAAQKIDYMAMISSEGSAVKEDRLSRLSHENAEHENPTIATTEAEAVLTGNVEIDAARRAILDRVEGTGFNRSITIIQGDTLAVIAQAVYGDTLRYRDIYSANSDVLADPNDVSVGLVLTLPAN